MSHPPLGDLPRDGDDSPGRPDHGSTFELIHGDCRDVLPLLPDQVFDACVTDPPYGIGIADWDQDVPGVDVWAAVLRVLKPGAALVAFGARRTYHRLATNVAEAGFVVKDMASWVYKTGRPPSRQHLRPAHEPILIARAPGPPIPVNIDAGRIPWRDERDRCQVRRIDTLRRGGRRRRVYASSLDQHGQDSFAASAGGRWPSTVMETDEALGDAGHVFAVPKVRNVTGHVCSKPVELLTHIVKLYVPENGVLLDPFAGSAPLAAVATETGRRAVLVERSSARDSA